MSEIGSKAIPGVASNQNDNLTLMNACLKILDGPRKDTVLPLNQLRMVVGRNDPPAITVDLDLTDYELEKDFKISRRHAEFEWDDGNLYLIDLPNTNGTWIDNEKVQRKSPNEPSERKMLHVGTLIRFANLETEVIIRNE